MANTIAIDYEIFRILCYAEKIAEKLIQHEGRPGMGCLLCLTDFEASSPLLIKRFGDIQFVDFSPLVQSAYEAAEWLMHGRPSLTNKVLSARALVIGKYVASIVGFKPHENQALLLVLAVHVGAMKLTNATMIAKGDGNPYFQKFFADCED